MPRLKMDDWPMIDGRTPGICLSLPRQVVLDLEERPGPLVFQRNEDAAIVRRAAEAATNREIRKVCLGQLLEEARDFLAPRALVHV